MTGLFDWEREQGWLLGAFFSGYVATQIPGGGWQLYGVGVLITAIFTLVTTLAANMSIYALVLVRIIEGVIEEQAGRARVRRSIESCRLTHRLAMVQFLEDTNMS